MSKRKRPLKEIHVEVSVDEAVRLANLFMRAYRAERETLQAALEHVTQCELYIEMLEGALQKYLPEAFGT